MPDDFVARRIVAAARTHFFRHGFRGVTMSDLAAEIGISKKTLYVHFSGKQALITAVIENKFQELEAALETPGTKPRDFAATLHDLLTSIQTHAKEISPSFARDLMRETPGIFLAIQTRRQELIGRTFGRLLRQGQEERAIRRDVSPDFLVEVLLGATQTVVTPEKVAVTGLHPGKLIERILSIFLEGTLTEKGRKTL